MPIRNQPQSAQAASAPNLETGVRERPSDAPCAASAGEQDEHAAASRAHDDDDPTIAARGSQFRQRDEELNSLIVRDDLTREGVLPEGNDQSAAGSRLRDRDARESAGAAGDEPDLTIREDESPVERDEPKADPTADDGRESGFRERDERDERVENEESDDDAYELQDHEFTLEPEDATIEIATHLSVPPPISLVPPPLPPWAAASRALLDNSLDALDEHNDRTIEIPPPPVVNDASKSADGGSAWPADDWSDLAEPSTSATPAIPRPVIARTSDREAKRLSLHEQLITVTRHKRAREVYLQEVERALASANGRLRGQAFRIAELEEELHETRAAAIAAALSAKRPRKPRKATPKTRAKAPAKTKSARPGTTRKGTARKKSAPAKPKRAAGKRRPSPKKSLSESRNKKARRRVVSKIVHKSR